MKQSRFASFLEQCLNTASGFLLSLAAQWWFLPLIGVAISFEQNIVFACFMTLVSLARGYGWRRLMEALHIRTPLSPAMLAIIAERTRQKSVEGWTEEHDDRYVPGELARAGAAYALYAPTHERGGRRITRDLLAHIWPWKWTWWKPTSFRRDLVKAGALILADLERHDRDRRRRVDPPAPQLARPETIGELVRSMDAEGPQHAQAAYDKGMTAILEQPSIARSIERSGI